MKKFMITLTTNITVEANSQEEAETKAGPLLMEQIQMQAVNIDTEECVEPEPRKQPHAHECEDPKEDFGYFGEMGLMED